jgi:N-acetylmuramoyl-L-alanine amidase
VNRDDTPKKRKKVFLFLFLFALISLSIYIFLERYGKTNFKSYLLSSKVICIDPGHQAHANLNRGSTDSGSGTKGILSGVPEYQITLAISLKLKNLLEKKGAKVVMTREINEVDISNVERAEIANRSNADLFVRIHADGNTDTSQNGISVLYPAKYQWTKRIYVESKRAAQLTLDELSVTTGAKKNMIVARGDITGFNWSKVPVILVETGYLTNPREDKLLNTDDYQWKVAQGICNGILRFFNRKWYERAKDKFLKLLIDFW